MVLGRTTHHRRTADVDLLDALVRARPGGDGIGERVEVHHDEIESRNAQFGQLIDVRGFTGVGEDTGVHLGVQRLDPAVEALGKTGHLRHLDHRDTLCGDGLRGRPGGHDLHAGA